MASGKPVVSTKCGGSEDLIVQGETGLLVPIGDHVSMATAIIKIITDNSISRHFATAGRKLTETFFSREAYIRNIQNIILAVSKTHGLI
jgi:glycosyltransferase involved in cell wall biosynthesis